MSWFNVLLLLACCVLTKPAKIKQHETFASICPFRIPLSWFTSDECRAVGLTWMSCFVFQSDNLLSYLTVEETLTYTAQLALQKHSAEAIRKKVKPESLLISVWTEKKKKDVIAY